ncbi:hypothetical protein [Spirosoma endbachense]|uniref:Uncharacterized protein n=1 Tax=Spirosoma endbachense TaxID=2666025 RepID=A0A6P1W7F8_9BACT|nr:hypothetical protein [Spirosoma endbachense]QHW00835.1 hypothetical protein GJR95_39975 [Spirosoma endbachense]
MVTEKLSPLQLELLKVYSFQPSDEDLQAIKKILAEYFSNKQVGNLAKAEEEKGISQDDLDRWLNE